MREQLGLDQVEWLSVAAAPSAYAMLEFHHAIGLDLAEVWGMSEFIMAIMNPPGARQARHRRRPAAGRRGAPGGRRRAARCAARTRCDPARMLDTEGWPHSGDLAAIDEDGYFKIIGRKKEVMINSSGKNLFPAKIEAPVKETRRWSATSP